MARIQGVSKADAGPMVRLIYRFGPRMMKKMTGRAPQTGSGLEPMELWALQPKMMMAMGRFNQAIRKGKSVDERIKNLAELKGAQMIGCEFCVDLGSQICRNSGFSDDELLALPHYRDSDLFTERDKTVALDYTVAVMRTPVEVTDELVRAHAAALHRSADRRDHGAADARQPRPLQCGVRHRRSRLLRGHGVRAAGPADQRGGTSENRNCWPGLSCATIGRSSLYHDRDHRVAARRRVVGEQQDRPAVRWHLDRARHEALGQQFARAGAIQARSVQPQADAVGRMVDRERFAR